MWKQEKIQNCSIVEKAHPVLCCRRQASYIVKCNFKKPVKIKLNKCMLLTPTTSVWKAVPKPLASVFWGDVYNACWSLECERLILKNRLTKKENYFWLANFSPLATVCGHSTLQGFSFYIVHLLQGFFCIHFFFLKELNICRQCLEMLVAFFFLTHLYFISHSVVDTR